ncbi:MAG: acyl-CoA--6-aminopenicillanic acid acyl-transferase [Herpetosiphon sp.]
MTGAGRLVCYNGEVEARDLVHEQSADYRVVELWGSPTTMARRQSRYLRPVGTPFRTWPWEGDRPFLQACVAILRDIAPWLWEEVAAFADSIGLPAERGLFIRAGGMPQGCSAVAWRAANGHILVGRTYDFYTRMPTRHLLVTTPAAGLAHLGMNGGLVGGRYEGVNEAGLFVGLHKVMTDRPPTLAPGLPYHLLPRLVLQQCTSALDAAALIASVPHLASFNYTLADADGHLIALECYPGQPVVQRHSDEIIAVTNHYCAPGLRAFQGPRPVADSMRRQDALSQIRHIAGDPWMVTAEALADHPSGVCCHREFGATLWAGLFDLSDRRAAYCFGAPCRNPWTPVSFPGTV